MPQTIFGLPLHPLVVHATVVIVPAAALAVLLAATWPRFRRWAGWLPVALSVAAVVLTPLSTSTGENLEHRVGETHLVEEHAELADLLLPWVIALLVTAAALYWAQRRQGGTARSRGWLGLALVVVPVLVALGTTVQVVLIGHSGAQAAWQGVASDSASGGEASAGR